MDTLLLVPQPRELAAAEGTLDLQPGRRIVLAGAPASQLQPIGRRLQAALAAAGLDWQLSATEHDPATIGARLTVDAARAPHAQGYTLAVSAEGVELVGHDLPGLFYGVCTLAQIIQQRGARLPALQISDWPDYLARGVMLDISRDKVPTLETLLELIELLAGWKINQLQLYTEHTFAYANHQEVWANASPLSGDEILRMDAFCRERFIELVPNQNTFGHMHRWLKHPRYQHMAETMDEFMTPWNMTMQGPFGLYPGEPGSIELVREMLDELLPHFASDTVNVGCDETIDLGQGRSREDVEQRGEGRVYLDFLLQIEREVRARGKTMQFWGDIIMNHPELVGELPRDAVALEWGYEASHPFAEHAQHFAKAGVPFYVCPGTSSWCSLGGRTDNALGNLASAAEHGLRNGAIGLLITDWGDRGHWQQLPISFLGLLAGAAYSWALEANRGLDVPAALSLHAFGDPSGATGRVAYDLGNVYQAVGVVPHNSSVLFWALQLPIAEIKVRSEQFGAVDAPALERTLAAIDAALAPLNTGQIGRSDAGLVAAEFMQAANLMRHACRRLQFALGQGEGAGADRAALAADLEELLAEQRRLWLARNRPGGLDDSLARFDVTRADYQ